jgi:hypothetical protein
MWRRLRRGGTVRLRLAEGLLAPQAPGPEQPDVVVRGRCRRHNGNWLVSLFLENRQSEPSRRRHAPLWIFQVQMSATGGDDRPVFLPRPERRGGGDHGAVGAGRCCHDIPDRRPSVLLVSGLSGCSASV